MACLPTHWLIQKHRFFLGAVFVCSVWLSSSMALAQDSAKVKQLTSEQKQAEQQKAQLQKQIQQIHQEMDKKEGDKKDVLDQLQKYEKNISALNARLEQLQTQQDKAREDLKDLRRQEKKQKTELTKRQDALSEQLYIQYTSGLNPWAVLLSGGDAQKISRDMGYLSYVSQDRAKAVQALNKTIKHLETLGVQINEQQDKLSQLEKEAQTDKTNLKKEQAVYAQQLKSLEKELSDRQHKVNQLSQDQHRLDSLIGRIGQNIDRQRKADRDAQIKRQQEQAQRQKEQEAEQAARVKEAQEQLAQAQQQASEDAEIDRAKAKLDQEKAAQAQYLAQQAKEDERKAKESANQEGLSKGAPWPVRGSVQANYGAPSPDGGIWHGMIIRANSGTSVKAVGSGRVVYADWMRGFGNLLIIDHGDDYMSVYGYNQSLLVGVGDQVKAGQVVARVGSTGGQVEPALYFEIRRNAKAIDPLTLLSQ